MKNVFRGRRGGGWCVPLLSEGRGRVAELFENGKRGKIVGLSQIATDNVAFNRPTFGRRRWRCLDNTRVCEVDSAAHPNRLSHSSKNFRRSDSVMSFARLS